MAGAGFNFLKLYKLTVLFLIFLLGRLRTSLLFHHHGDQLHQVADWQQSPGACPARGGSVRIFVLQKQFLAAKTNSRMTTASVAS